MTTSVISGPGVDSGIPTQAERVRTWELINFGLLFCPEEDTRDFDWDMTEALTAKPVERTE